MVSRGRHASGLEHLCTTRPSGFEHLCTTRPGGFSASLSSPSWVMVSRRRHASGLEHLCTTRPSGFRASLSSPSWVMVSRGRHASGLEHLWTTRPSGSTARCGRRASGLGQRCTTRPSGFAPPERGVPAGPTFSNTPVDRRHPLDTIRSTEAGRARETSGNCECGTTAQAGSAASSVSFRGDGARREAATMSVPVRADSWRSGTTRAAGRLRQGGLHVGATRRGSAASHTFPDTPCFDV